MKKIISLVLAAMLTLSLAACGTKNDSKGDQPAAPASALDLLEKVWSTYTDDEKFPAAGGDYSEANSKEDAPGVYDLTDRAAVDSALGLPETAKVDQAASLVHMMNQNTFTAAAYHCTDDADALATALRDNIQQRQWMCGFPDKLVIFTYDQYVVSLYGDEELVNTFRDKLQAAYSDAAIAYDEMIGEGEFSDGEDTALEVPVA